MHNKHLVGIDLNGNELINAILDPRATTPTAEGTGHTYYDTATQSLKVYDGTAFQSQLKSVTGTGAISVNTTTTPGVAAISIANATESVSGLMPAASVALLNAATDAVTANALLKRDANGQIIVAEPTADDHAASKSYVDTLVSSGMRILGGIDASTDPDYPAAVKGDAYKVTADGIIGDEEVTVGDMIIAIDDTAAGDQATVGANWLVLQDNVDSATEFTPGYIRLATVPEIVALSAPDVAISPLSLGAVLNAREEANSASFVLALGGTKYQLQHNFDAEVNLTVYQETSRLQVNPIIRRVNDNTFEVEVNKALTDRLIVLVTKVTANLTTTELAAMVDNTIRDLRGNGATAYFTSTHGFNGSVGESPEGLVLELSGSMDPEDMSGSSSSVAMSKADLIASGDVEDGFSYEMELDIYDINGSSSFYSTGMSIISGSEQVIGTVRYSGVMLNPGTQAFTLGATSTDFGSVTLSELRFYKVAAF